MSEPVELGDLSGLAEGELTVFEDIGEYGVVVCRVEGSLHAIEDNCSHADTPLSEGRLRGCKLICPLHGAQFDVRDGTHSGPPAWEGVTSFRVTERDGNALLEAKEDPEGPGPNRDVGARFRTR